MGAAREPAVRATPEAAPDTRTPAAPLAAGTALLAGMRTPAGTRALQRAIGNRATARVLARDDTYVPSLMPHMSAIAERELDADTKPPSQRMLNAYKQVSYDRWKASGTGPAYWKERNLPWEFFGGQIGKSFGARDPVNPEEGGPQQTCAARLSWALNNLGGADIKDGMKYPNPSSVVYAGKPGDGKNYIVSAWGMMEYLKKHWGKPDVELKTNQMAKDFKEMLDDDQAIVFAGVHHVGMISKQLRVQDYIEYDPDVVPASAWILQPWK